MVGNLESFLSLLFIVFRSCEAVSHETIHHGAIKTGKILRQLLSLVGIFANYRLLLNMSDFFCNFELKTFPNLVMVEVNQNVFSWTILCCGSAEGDICKFHKRTYSAFTKCCRLQQVKSISLKQWVKDFPSSLSLRLNLSLLSLKGYHSQHFLFIDHKQPFPVKCLTSK